jgi:hypothetical protein
LLILDTTGSVSNITIAANFTFSETTNNSFNCYNLSLGFSTINSYVTCQNTIDNTISVVQDFTKSFLLPTLTSASGLIQVPGVNNSILVLDQTQGIFQFTFDDTAATQTY